MKIKNLDVVWLINYFKFVKSLRKVSVLMKRFASADNSVMRTIVAKPPQDRSHPCSEVGGCINSNTIMRETTFSRRARTVVRQSQNRLRYVEKSISVLYLSSFHWWQFEHCFRTSNTRFNQPLTCSVKYFTSLAAKFLRYSFTNFFEFCTKFNCRHLKEHSFLFLKGKERNVFCY